MGIEFLLKKEEKGNLGSEDGCSSPLEILARVMGGINLLRGLFLFVTFCCKKKVWNLLSNSCGRKKPTFAGRQVPKIKYQAPSTVVALSMDKEPSTEEDRTSSLQIPGARKKQRRVSTEGSEDQKKTPKERANISLGDHILNELLEKSAEAESSGELVNQNQLETEKAKDALVPHTSIRKKREEKILQQRKSSRWTQRFSTSPSELGPGWVRSLRMRMEGGSATKTSTASENGNYLPSVGESFDEERKLSPVKEELENEGRFPG